MAAQSNQQSALLQALHELVESAAHRAALTAAGLAQLPLAQNAAAQGESQEWGHLLAAFVNTVPSAMVLLDSEGRVRAANAAAQVLSVGGVEAFLGRSLERLRNTTEPRWPLDDSNGPIARALSSGEGQQFEYVLASEAEDRSGVGTAVPISDRVGDLIGVLVVVEDLTQQLILVRDLVHSQQRLQALNAELEGRVHERTVALERAVDELQVEMGERQRAESERLQLSTEIDRQRALLAAATASMSDGLMLLDADRQVLYCNSKAGEMLGIDPSLALGKLAFEVVAAAREGLTDDESMELWNRAILDTQETPPFRATFERGLRIDIVVSSFPIAFGEPGEVGTALLLKDVTVSDLLTRAKEQERIAMDLHDGAIQSLFGVALQLAAAQRAANGDAGRLSGAVQQAIGQINHAILDIRGYTSTLRLDEFVGRGLSAGLGAIAVELSGAALISPELEIDPDLDAIVGPVSAAQVLHIVHEATANLARHSGATAATISLAREQGCLVLRVEDNGRGFSPRSTGRRAGDGLRNMAERARAIGGQLTVNSQPGGGVCVLLTVPMHQGRLP